MSKKTTQKAYKTDAIFDSESCGSSASLNDTEGSSKQSVDGSTDLSEQAVIDSTVEDNQTPTADAFESEQSIINSAELPSIDLTGVRTLPKDGDVQVVTRPQNIALRRKKSDTGCYIPKTRTFTIEEDWDIRRKHSDYSVVENLQAARKRSNKFYDEQFIKERERIYFRNYRLKTKHELRDELKMLEEKNNTKAKRYGVGKGSPIIGTNGMILKEGESAEFAQRVLDIVMWGDVDKDDLLQLQRRFSDVIKYCIDHNMRITNQFVYLGIGITKKDADKWDKNGRDFPEHCEFIRKVKQFCAAYRETLGAENKLNPITLIWWQRNYDEMTERSEVSHTINVPEGSKESVKDIIKRYAESLPEQTDIYEVAKEDITVADLPDTTGED